MADNTTKRFQCPRHWTVEQRFNHYADKAGGPDACWLWTARVSRYGQMTLPKKRSTALAHRVSYQLFRGPIPDGLFVLHECDVPACVNPAHLFLGTHDDNMADKVAKGRQLRLNGERNGGSKLTEATVRAIRMADGSQTVIASKYGITRASVSLIKRRLLWKHVA